MTRPVPPYGLKLATAERETATSVGKGHGRRERRTITTTTALNGYLDWPGIGQVFRLVRERRVGGITATETVYGITSLTRSEADAGRLLELVRTHWSIESELHHVRDVTLKEDACRVRTGFRAASAGGAAKRGGPPTERPGGEEPGGRDAAAGVPRRGGDQTDPHLSQFRKRPCRGRQGRSEVELRRFG